MNQLPSNLLESMKDALAVELGVDRDFDTGASLLVVTGANAAGKSLLRRWFSMIFQQEKIESIHLSQQGRAAEGVMRAFVYGDESNESTGVISAGTFQGGMRTMRGREKPHAVIWDEPEIGMGEELQVGTVNWLCDELKDWPENLQGVVLFTHSRLFVQRAMQFPGAKWMSMDGYATADEWLNREIVPITPPEVSTKGVEKFRRISKILKKGK